MNQDLSMLKQNLKKGFIGKILPLTLAGTIAFSSALPAKKAQAYNLEVPSITLEEFENYEYTKMFLSGRQIEFTKETGAPYTKSKKIMVPLEAFADAFYAVYKYDESEKTADLMRFGKTVNFKVKSKKVIITEGDNKSSKKAKVATTIKNGKVYVQLSTLASALDLSVRTDKKTGIIHVEHKDNFKNIDFKEKKLISIKKVDEKKIDTLILDWANVPVEYLDVLKNSNQYKVFIENKTAYVFSYQFLSHLDYFYEQNKLYKEQLYSSYGEKDTMKLKNLFYDKREYLDERLFFRRVTNITAYSFCWSALGYNKMRDVSCNSTVRFSPELEKVVKEIADDIKSKNVSEREQVKLACEAIGERCEYTKEAIGSDAKSALVYGKAVCTGYEEAFEYILRALEIPVVNVTGSKYDEGHTWAHVYVDGKWLLVDPTAYDKQKQGTKFLFLESISKEDGYGYTYSEDYKKDIELLQLTYKFY